MTSARSQTYVLVHFHSCKRREEKTKVESSKVIILVGQKFQMFGKKSCIVQFFNFGIEKFYKSLDECLKIRLKSRYKLIYRNGLDKIRQYIENVFHKPVFSISYRAENIKFSDISGHIFLE